MGAVVPGGWVPRRRTLAGLCRGVGQPVPRTSPDSPPLYLGSQTSSLASRVGTALPVGPREQLTYGFQGCLHFESTSGARGGDGASQSPEELPVSIPGGMGPRICRF